MKEKQKIELLSPAGNKESFEAACQNGADAIYMGLGQYNARVMAKNFEEAEYIECIKEAHLRDVKVYLTLNTVLYEEEVKEALEQLQRLYQAGLDAVIVQDVGLAMLIHQMFPKLPLHASTQMSVYSLPQAKFLENIGFSRVVLARELSIEEIAEIAKQTSLEIEVFVHGALCVSYSGQCLLSTVIGRRSANRGRCAQPCRMKYSLYRGQGKEVKAPTYLLSKKDILGIEHLKELQEAGVHSFKIEGRNKTPEYVAGVTSIYRKYVDQLDKKETYQVAESDIHTLAQIFNRDGQSSGYLKGVSYLNSITLHAPKNTGSYLGKVMGQKGVYVKLQLAEDVSLQDGFEIDTQGEPYSSIVTCIKDEHFATINEPQTSGTYIWIGDVNAKVSVGADVYKTSSNALNQRYRATFANGKQTKKIEIPLSINIQKDQPLQASMVINGEEVVVALAEIPALAQSKPLDAQKIAQVFEKTNDTPYTFVMKKIVVAEGLFLPVATLNAFRRKVLETVMQQKLALVGRKEVDIQKELAAFETAYVKSIPKREEPLTSLHFYHIEGRVTALEEFDRIYVSIFDYIQKKDQIFTQYAGKEIYIAIPNVIGKHMDRYISEHLEEMLQDGVHGFLLGSFQYLERLLSYRKQYQFGLVADYSFNIANRYSALWMQHIGFDMVVPSCDISLTDIVAMARLVPVEVVEDYITVMTSRYCILGSFIANREEGANCKKPCAMASYYIKDSYGVQYPILCDSTDCIMRVLKRIRPIDWREIPKDNIASVRNTRLS